MGLLVRRGVACGVAGVLSAGCAPPPPRVESAPRVFAGWVGDGGRDEWRFVGGAGELVAVEAHSEDFDTVVRLIASDGGVIASSDDVGQDSDAGLLRVLPVSGEYGVEVSAYIFSSGGAYVAVARLVEARPLEPDAPVTVTADGVSDVWSFGAEADRMVRVEVGSDDFDTFVRVLSASGEEVASDDDGGVGIDSCVEMALPGPGRYLVEVAEWYGGIRRPRAGDVYALALWTAPGGGDGAGCAGVAE